MALTPSYEKKSFVPKKVFTGRADETNLFLDSLLSPQGSDEYKVLHWYGVGGQGKSALSRECMRLFNTKRDAEALRAQPQYFEGARIELEVARQRQPDQALLALRSKLGASGKISFAAFDLAFGRYAALSDPARDIRLVYPRLFGSTGRSEILSDLAELSETPVGQVARGVTSAFVPGLDLMVKYGSRVGSRARDWWKKRGKSEMLGLDGLSEDQLLEKLPTYFGMDIRAALGANPRLRLLIMIDGYEALWRDSNISSASSMGMRVDRWVRRLIQDAPGVLVCILGRDKIAWEAMDDDWIGVVDSYPLGAILDDQAHVFLQRVPIPEKDVRGAIIRGAEGLPFYLDLQVDMYAAARSNGELPDAARFGGSHDEILDRFVDHLSENRENELRLVSYLQSVTEMELNALADQFLGGAASVNWSELARQGFVKPIDDWALNLALASGDGIGDAIELHTLMREGLQDRELRQRPQLFADVHRWLFNRLAAGIPEHVSEITFRHGAIFLAALGHANHLEDTHDWELETREKLQRAHQSLWLERYWAGKYTDALELHGRAHPDTLKARHNLALQLGSLGNHRAARDEFKAVYDIQKRPDVLGETHSDTLKTRHELAYQLGELGDYRAARDEFQAVFNVQKSSNILGLEHVETLSTRHNLALQLGDLGEHSRARDEYQAIYEIRNRLSSLGPEHPNTLVSRHNLAQQVGHLGGHSVALDEFKAIYQIQKRTGVLGPEHLNTVTTRHNLAYQLSCLERHLEAREEYQAIYDIRRRPDGLGRAHPYTQIAKSSLSLTELRIQPDRSWLIDLQAAQQFFSSRPCEGANTYLFRATLDLCDARILMQDTDGVEVILRDLLRDMERYFVSTHYLIRRAETLIVRI